MDKLGRSFILTILISFLIMTFLAHPVMGVEVIQRQQPAEPEAPAGGGIMSPLQGVVDFLSASWFPILIIAILFFFAMMLMKWWNTKREQDNVFLRDYNRTVRSCVMQSNSKRIHKRAFWVYILALSTFISVLFFVIALVTDDVPAFQLAIGIFLGGLVISFILKFAGFLAQHDPLLVVGRFGAKFVGSYLGECVTSDGYKNYLLWNARKYIFWKNSFILKVNMNDKYQIETVDQKTNKRVIESHDLPNDLIVDGDAVIVIKGEGVDQSGYFYYPLITDEKGNIVNMDLVAFSRAKDVAILDTMYQQTEDFSKVQRQAINMNPNVRYVMRTRGDTITGAEDSG